MSAGQSYVLGIFTPFICLLVVGVWMWCTEEAGKWWQTKQPTLGRFRCTLTGHRYIVDNTWVVCSRCSHAKRDPRDRYEALRVDQ